MDEQTTLRYIKDLELYQKEKPYYFSKLIPTGLNDTNIEYEEGPEQRIADVRGHEEQFTLDDHGFCFLKWEPPKVDWDSESDIVTTYLPAVQALVTQHLGPGLISCEIFDWRVRQHFSHTHSFPLTSRR